MFFAEVLPLVMVNDNCMNTSEKQVEAAIRISKMGLRCENNRTAFIFFTSYIGSILKYSETGSLTIEELERGLNRALRYSNGK